MVGYWLIFGLWRLYILLTKEVGCNASRPSIVLRMLIKNPLKILRAFLSRNCNWPSDSSIARPYPKKFIRKELPNIQDSVISSSV